MSDLQPEPTGTEDIDRTPPVTRWGAAIDYGLAVAFALWTASAFLRPDRLVISFDTIAYSGPNTAFTAQELGDGRLPVWNDTIFGGAPHLANLHAGVLYPFRAVFAFLDPVRAVNTTTAFHVVLLAVGMVVLARGRLGLRCPAGLVASVGVIGSGMLAIRTLQLEQLIGLSWIPWLLAAIDWAIRDVRRSGWSIVAVAAVTAMMVLGGHAQSTFAGAVIAAVWAVARAVDHGRFGALARTAGGALVGGLLAAPQALTALALASRATSVSQRSLADTGVPGFVLSPRRLVVAVLGDGSALNQAFVTGNTEAATSIGVAVCSLALLAVILAALHRRDRWTQLVLGAVAVGALLMALGPRTPVYRLAFSLVPGIDSARVPGRWRDLTVVAACLLAAFAIDAVARADVTARAVAAWVVSLVVAGSVIAVGPFDLPSTTTVWWWIAAAAAVVAAAAAVVVGARPGGERRRGRRLAAAAAACVLAEMAFLGPPMAWDSSFPESVDDLTNPATVFLAEQTERTFALTTENLGDPAYVLNALRPNANALVDIRSLDGYDGGVQVTDEWIDGVSALATEPFIPDLMIRHQIQFPLDAELYARFGVRWVLYDTSMPLPLDDVFPGWGPAVVEGDGLAVFDNPAYDGDAHVFGSTLVVPDDEVPGDVLAEDPEAATAALVEPGGPDLDCGGCEPEAVDTERLHAGAIDVEVTPVRDALLVVAEQWDPGWHATVDGASAPVFEADGMFLGVELHAGDRRVELRYTAPGLRVGWALAAVSALICGALVSGPIRRRVAAAWERVRPG